jgi:hypothetical protein
MKRTLLLLAISASLLLGACGGKSSLPVATGKASIMAVNAISASPDIHFLIEERSIGSVPYKQSSAAASYDDLDYTFNFEVGFLGDTEITRFASQHIDFVADQQYALVAYGTLADPILTLWESTIREFTETETVFQARFGHTSNSLGSIDVYFALDGVVPVGGEQVATLQLGEVSDPIDYEAGDYVVTITNANEPAQVLFSSYAASLTARVDVVVTVFDGDANDTGQYVVRGLGLTGGIFAFHDPANPSTTEYLHAAMDLHAGVGDGTSDIYDDVDLTSLVISGHAYRDLTAAIPIAAGTVESYYTPFGETTVVSLEHSAQIALGGRYRLRAVGGNGEYIGISTLMNRRSIDTAAKLLIYHATMNYDFTDLYLVEPDTLIDEQSPHRTAMISRVPGPVTSLAAGSYDLYVTAFGEKIPLVGPHRLDVELGDVVDMTFFDTADPTVLEIVEHPIP